MGSLPETVVLFGPQRSDVDDSVCKIRRALREHPGLHFLGDVVDELPSLWPTISDALPGLTQIPGETMLVTLARSIREEDAPTTEIDPLNMLLTPLTVIRHIVEFWELGQGLDHPAFVAEASQRSRVTDVQGFCVGFLAAVPVACCQSLKEFAVLTAAVVRLAVCVGAAVDLDEAMHGASASIAIRWKSPGEYESLQQILARHPEESYISCVIDVDSVTVTVSSDVEQLLTQELMDHGLILRPIALRGRFHHESHADAAESILELCDRDSRFQLPSGSAACLPLKSNTDAQGIAQDMLHTIAVRSILTRQCNWVRTLSPMLGQLQNNKPQRSVMSIGSGQFVPRSIRTRLQHTNHFSQRNRAPAAPLIAITGMAGRYPHADSLEELWQLLELGKCVVQELPDSRFKVRQLQREPRGPFWAGLLQRPDAFDHRFFGISGREAESMDPQQRLLLQVAYQAMESAGYCGLHAKDVPRDVGCYVGVGSEDYTPNVASRHANAFSATGTLQAFISGRISHYFGWSGPSVVVDTACSSAAVSIHLACKALQTGECSIAVAGGVNVLSNLTVTQNLSAASFLSPTGASKAFDAAADGYCRGEGAGLVVLRRLDDALSNGDPILAVIMGSAVNQGSNSSPISVPSSDSQRALYEQVLSRAGVAADEISYIEAHGTGTQVGDPIEFQSLRKVFGGRHRAEKLFVGSLKDNIGHTETSSGVAGLLKTVLMMQKRRIPKQANFTRLNPKISPPPEHDRMVIPTQSSPWEPKQRLAMISNYGAAGSNAALVVKQYCAPGRKLQDDDISLPSEVPVFISAKSAESLQLYCRRLHAFIKDTPTLEVLESFVADLAYNLAVKQNRDMDFCIAFATSSASPAALLTRLESVFSSLVADIQKAPKNAPPVVLCFGGQNGNTATISQQLVNSCELLRFHLMECERSCQLMGLRSLFPTIFQADPVEDIVHHHCMLFSIQYACAKSWLDSGLQVARMIGHSFGQLTALCVAGSLSLSDGLRLISERARLIQRNWGAENGVMLSVECTTEELQRFLRDAENTVDVACYNGPRNQVLAGDETSIRAIEERINAQSGRIRMKRLTNTHAFHSRLVDPIVPGLMEVAQSLQFRPPSIPIEACSMDEEDWSSSGPSASNIVQHSRMPVFFQSAVERTLQRLQGQIVWLEAGSASPIIPMVRRVVEASSARSVPHVYRPLDLGSPQAPATLAKATCELWSNRVSVQFWPFQGAAQRRSLNWMSLPPYQFAEGNHWIDYDPSAFTAPREVVSETPSEQPAGLMRLLESNPHGESLFQINADDPLYQSCTKGHAVMDQSLCPASLYVEFVVHAASCIFDDDVSSALPHLQDMAISAPLVLRPQGSVFLRLSRTKAGHPEWSFLLFSRKEDDSSVTHASGMLSLHPKNKPSAIKARLHSLNRLVNPSRGAQIEASPESSGLKGSTVYQVLQKVTDYADYYWGVQKVFAQGHEAMGYVSRPEHSLSRKSACDPVLIDNFLQVAGIHVNCLSQRRDDEVYVCNGVGDIFGELLIRAEHDETGAWDVYTNYERPSQNQVSCDIFAIDRKGSGLVLAIMNVVFKSVSIRSLIRTLANLNSPGEARPEPAPTWTDELAAKLPQKTVPQTPVLGADNLSAVQTMLSNLLGVGMEELVPSSPLGDIGVDSLLAIEVLSEIKNRFQVNISTATLVDIPDIQGLVECIFSGFPTPESTQASTPTGPGPVQRQENGVDTEDPSTSDSSYNLTNFAGQCFDPVREDAAPLYDTQFVGFLRSVYPKQLALLTSYILEAFQSLGVQFESLAPGEAVPEISVLPRHEKLLRQLYSILERSHLVSRTASGTIVRTISPVPTTPSGILHNELISEYPQHAIEHQLIRVTGPHLAQCLTGETDGLSLIFKDADTRALLENVYTNTPIFKFSTLHLVRYIADILGQLGDGHDRKLRILEIGAGTGGTSKYLLNHLTETAGDSRHPSIEYTFTDISSSLVALARQKFAMYPFMKYATLDVEKSPPSTLQGKYDIVISSNCIHATRDLGESCRNVRRLLRPDGILCLTEFTREVPWLDTVFGLLEGWWQFADGRKHALASERLWEQTLRQAGFQWVDWTGNEMEESQLMRLIVASPSVPQLDSPPNITQQTVVFAERDGLELQADIYFPSDADSDRTRPVALMIHGGGHIMLSRKDVRAAQTRILLDAGFLPVSVEYRLCPEVSLIEGPMQDVRDALIWVRQTLPTLNLKRRDIRPDGERVVAVGWSTGAHLAMTLAWTSLDSSIIRPPDAILAFYGPTDYEDPFWSQPNFPFERDLAVPAIPDYDLLEGVYDQPIIAYNPPVEKRALGGWMSPTDPRSRIALTMNWKGLTLPVLLYGWQWKSQPEGQRRVEDLPQPSKDEIEAISPLAQIRSGRYKTPTFIIHGTLDDLIPWEQAKRTYEAMVENGVDAGLRIVDDAVHLFDIQPRGRMKDGELRAVRDGYEFLAQYAVL